MFILHAFTFVFLKKLSHTRRLKENIPNTVVIYNLKIGNL